MSVKLFVTDLDGTLLPNGRIVSPGNIKAVQAAVKAGVTVTIATGRMYQAALPVAEALGVNVPIITYNGALIKDTEDTVLYSQFLPTSIVGDVADFCRAQGWYIQSYNQDELYFAEYDRFAEFYEGEQQIKGHTVGWDGLKQQNDSVSKMLSITDSKEETDQRVAILQERFGDQIDAVRSNARYAEIISKGVSKASGIQRLAEVLKVPMAETMAIGDGDNDLPMLHAAGKSVAMGNAGENVKAVCDYETGDCLDDGFAQAIYEYVLK
jgi:Cof subfamily protein (haloacid dehalogenase superfamily)